MSPLFVDEEELKKLDEYVRRTDGFLLVGAVVFAVFVMILAGSLLYAWFTRW
jgi:hypothetical protein